jgi:hypothetical protein
MAAVAAMRIADHIDIVAPQRYRSNLRSGGAGIRAGATIRRPRGKGPEVTASRDTIRYTHREGRRKSLKGL